MQNPAIQHQLKFLLLCAAGLSVAILVGWNIGTANYGPLVLCIIIGCGACFWLFSGQFLWVLTVASSFLAGTFPILRGSFTPFQILMAMGIAKFLLEDVVLKRRYLRWDRRSGMFLILGFMAVLTFHALHDRLGMRFLGSNVWGGRNYINVYLGFAAFFVLQSIPMKPSVWAKLPYAILAVNAFDVSIALITTIFPASIYKIYPFYSAVSRTGIEEIVTGESGGTARLGSIGNFGTTLVAIVFAGVALTQILKPPLLRRVIVLGLGAVTVLLSSFRSAVFNTFGILFVAGIRDLKWRFVFLLPLLGLCLFTLSVVNSEVVRLPKQVQRSLTFVPGDWDSEMARDAADSNKFRREIWTLWAQDLFPAHPLMGRGFGFQSEWGKGSVFKNDPNATRQMVETGNMHNGFLAAVDCLGIVGTFFFLLWNLRLLFRMFQTPFGIVGPNAFTVRFVSLILGSAIICYWMGASDVGTFLPQEFALAAVLLRLQSKLDSAPERPATSGRSAARYESPQLVGS